MSDHPLTDEAILASSGQWSFLLRDLCRRLEQDLEQERQDRKQADLDTIRSLGERNDARAELEQIKTILADPLAVHLNMMRGTIQWTPANLRHLLGDSTYDLADHSEIDRELDACVARSARDWRPLPGDPDEPGDANRLQTETDDQAGDTA